MTPEEPIALARPSLVYPLSDILEPLPLSTMFPRMQPTELELGSGDGSFLVNYAELHGDRNFLAVERLLGRVRKLDRKGRARGLSNLQILRIEAHYLVDYLVLPDSLEAVHVYFPDPWPKNRHHKKRLINERFVESAARVLVPGGNVWLRTDDADYFEQMLTVFAVSDLFEPTETPEALSSITTDFEADFNRRGIPTLRAAYRLIER